MITSLGALRRVQAHAGVALLLGEVEVAVHAGHASKRPATSLGLGLDLLHAHTIGARFAAHSTKPLSAAERMPFRLSVTA
jgi:hypothetical protein